MSGVTCRAMASLSGTSGPVRRRFSAWVCGQPVHLYTAAIVSGRTRLADSLSFHLFDPVDRISSAALDLKGCSELPTCLPQVR